VANAVIAALQAHALQTPDDVALRGVSGALSYGELWQRVVQLSTWLRTQAVSVAGLSGENSVEWIIADLAAWHASVTLVPLPGFFSAAQLQHVLETTGLRHVLVCNGAAAVATDLNSVASPLSGIRLERLQVAPGTVAIAAGVCKITFTSGTTGTPKGVCLTTPMLEAVTRALAARIHAAPGMAEALRVHFTLLPLSTLLENIAGVYVPLLLGKSISVRPGAAIGLHGSSGLDLAALLRALQAAQPDSLIVLPQILQALVVAASQGNPLPPSLRFVAVGGAATPLALLRRAQTLGIPVYEGYGLSECASVVALNAPGANRPGSVGRVLDHVRVRIEDGAIEVAGNVSAGYLGSPTPDRGPWLDTGDLGHLDADGYLYVSGRRKNLLISSYGRNISPEWVEGELSLCPSIAQSMVIGDAQPFLAAIVVPRKDGSAADVARDIAATNAGLPDYARIRRFICAAEPFTGANQSLTENGRLRRDIIAARHDASIAALYLSSPSVHEPGPIHDLL
jgi:long-subunit acyl-CoA synthetase (AMP-forming)